MSSYHFLFIRTTESSDTFLLVFCASNNLSFHLAFREIKHVFWKSSGSYFDLGYYRGILIYKKLCNGLYRISYFKFSTMVKNNKRIFKMLYYLEDEIKTHIKLNKNNKKTEIKKKEQYTYHLLELHKNHGS